MMFKTLFVLAAAAAVSAAPYGHHHGGHWHNGGNNGGNSQQSTAASSSSDAAPTGQTTTGKSYSGPATWYDISNPAENEGYAPGSVACSDNKYSKDSNIVAVPTHLFSQGDCNKWVQITDKASGKTTTAQVMDECMGCQGEGLDLTDKVWADLFGGAAKGMIDIEWAFTA